MMAIGATTWRVSTVGAALTSTGGGDGGQEPGEAWLLLLLQPGLRGSEPSAPLPHQPGPKVHTHLLLQFGRTEVIDNTLNPDFVRKFIVDYFFEEKQNLRFDL